MGEVLKPCPFCGGEAAIEQTGRQELTLRCVGVQPSGLKGCGPKFVQKVKAHSLEWLSGKMAERWNSRAALSGMAEPFAWYWYDSYDCLYITGDDRKPDVPAEAKPLFTAPPASDLREENRWQPIETAPRDRTPILLGYEGWLHPVVGFYAITLGCWVEHGTKDPKANIATKWMPLPDLHAALNQEGK